MADDVTRQCSSVRLNWRHKWRRRGGDSGQHLSPSATIISLSKRQSSHFCNDRIWDFIRLPKIYYKNDCTAVYCFSWRSCV